MIKNLDSDSETENSTLKDLSLNFNKRDITVLQIAGLCHDLGHTAFSHLFDNEILPSLNPLAGFKHETASFLILEMINQRLNILNPDELNLVGKLIYGSYSKVHPDLKDRLVWTEVDHQRTFLFQILSNEIHNNNHRCSHLCNDTNIEANGYSVDVDKFDYLKRDCLFTGIKETFDYTRLIELIKLQKQDNRIVLFYDKKAHELIKSMWTARNDLHRRVYQHRVVKCIDKMYVNAFIAASPYLYFKGKTEILNIKDIHLDMVAYCRLTDNIINTIADLALMHPEIPDLKLIDRVRNRKLWKLVDVKKFTSEQKFTALPGIVHAECNLNGEYIYYFWSVK